MRLFGLCLVSLALITVSVPARAQDAGIPCGNVGYTGCCLDDTHSQYCSSKGLVTKTCSGSTPLCGWKASSSFYTCTTGTDSDPSGTYPRLCSDLPDGGIPDPDKGIKKEAGATADLGPTIPCGPIPSQGCCLDDTHTKYCASGALKTKTCSSGQTCLWVSSSTPGYYCSTTAQGGVTQDPSGTYPRYCSAYETDGPVTPKQDKGTVVNKEAGGILPDISSFSDYGTEDSSTTPPAKQDKGTTKKKTDDDGCSCAVGSTRSSGLFLLLLAAALLASLARKRR